MGTKIPSVLPRIIAYKTILAHSLAPLETKILSISEGIPVKSESLEGHNDQPYDFCAPDCSVMKFAIS
jgi:hypothetical protein